MAWTYTTTTLVLLMSGFFLKLKTRERRPERCSGIYIVDVILIHEMTHFCLFYVFQAKNFYVFQANFEIFLSVFDGGPHSWRSELIVLVSKFINKRMIELLQDCGFIWFSFCFCFYLGYSSASAQRMLNVSTNWREDVEAQLLWIIGGTTLTVRTIY